MFIFCVGVSEGGIKRDLIFYGTSSQPERAKDKERTGEKKERLNVLESRFFS